MNTRTEILIFQRTGSMKFFQTQDGAQQSLWHVLNTSQERSTNDIKEVSLCKKLSVGLQVFSRTPLMITTPLERNRADAFVLIFVR